MEEPSATIERLAGDRSRGASEITDDALPALASIARQADDPRQAILPPVRTLLRAHPAMAPLVHLANELLIGLAAEGLTCLDRIEQEHAQRGRQLVHALADRLAPVQAVATYSRSGTVLSGIQARHTASPSIHVTLSEARPGGEGIQAARQLASHGIPVTLTSDAALPARLREVDLLVVGADALCRGGLVNKVGTGTLLEEARDQGTPSLVVAGTDKVLPAAYREQPALTTQGVLDHDLPSGIELDLPLFECVPLRLADAVLTEEGERTPNEIHNRIQAAEVAGELLEIG